MLKMKEAKVIGHDKYVPVLYLSSVKSFMTDTDTALFQLIFCHNRIMTSYYPVESMGLQRLMHEECGTNQQT